MRNQNTKLLKFQFLTKDEEIAKSYIRFCHRLKISSLQCFKNTPNYNLFKKYMVVEYF